MENRESLIRVAEDQLIAKAKKDGVETAWDRKDALKIPCGFGSAGVCCRTCSMGPCRVSPVPGKGNERGICGATADVIVSRNFARMVAAGAASHSDHGRSMALHLHKASRDGEVKIKDEKKLLKEAISFAGPGLSAVCKLINIPPVLHMGSCVDISRNLELVGELANYIGVDISDLPVVGVAPEWMSEKAVGIGMYVVGSGIDTWLGVVPPVTGSPAVVDYLTNKMEDIYGAKFYIEEDPEKAAAQMIERIEVKRKKLGI